MTKTIHGKIRGKTIELDEDLGVADGQEVEVQVRIVQPARKWGEGILRTAVRSPTTPSGTRLWSRSIKTEKWNAVPRRMRNDASIGHKYLFSSHATPRRSCASILPACRGTDDFHRRPGGTLRRGLQTPQPRRHSFADRRPPAGDYRAGLRPSLPREFGKVKGELLQKGVSIPEVDLMIATAALVHNLTLVTHNTADFQNIPGLRLEDWLTP